ncbi:aromatic ring-hydroxylating dioxygenase subunit alpha [Novosphingobium profundi]|uniref:aromatic ring-hydroxylating oxygenase subunit alpha n=1 Tax=Novosphingobium profundi TaxID=1774954 RepID=UPI001BDA92C5|nr:aromatic ring-hydroxylating dioxygenase subunit alpha [Novosphingobium profundi]MBT0670282.1 aromatic ring-hydroxylating dioxygenase subunit alpha [Novosphingobium profundi]
MDKFSHVPLPEMALSPQIRRLLDQLDASQGDVASAMSLPPECYTSEEWFEFEKRAVFDSEWTALGHVGAIPENGDYFALEVLGEPLLVVRGKDGEVRVLSSVCRHRGHLLGDAPRGKARGGFTCPFHGWSYDLEGTLTGAPEMEGTLPFEQLRHTACLPEFRSTIWNGFIFVNFSGEAEPLAPRLKGLTSLVENHHMADLAAITPVEWADNAWNWKFMQENALEPYHTHYLHSGIHDFAPSTNVRFTEWQEDDDAAIYREVHFTNADGGFNISSKALFPPLPDLTEEERARVVFAGVMPNLFFGAQGDVVFYYVILPQSAGNITLSVGMLTSWDNLSLPTAPLLLKGTLDGVQMFNEQDTVANIATHKGLRSRVAPRTRWAPNEKTLVQLSNWLIKRYKRYAARVGEALREDA